MTIKSSDTSWSTVVKNYLKCPHCEKGILDTRIPRSYLVKNVFTWVGKKRYQCNTCGKKSYV